MLSPLRARRGFSSWRCSSNAAWWKAVLDALPLQDARAVEVEGAHDRVARHGQPLDGGELDAAVQVGVEERREGVFEAIEALACWQTPLVLFLLTGGVSMEDPPKCPQDWVPARCWSELFKLNLAGGMFEKCHMKFAGEGEKWKALYDTFDPLPQMKEEDARPNMIKGDRKSVV